jgi:TRAP-type transport system periplasmic protein
MKRRIIMKRLFAPKCLATLFFIFCCLAWHTGNAQEKVISLRMATFMPATMLQGQVLQSWATEIEKRTNGRVKITIYPGGTLLPVTQMYDGITKEIADIGYGIFAYIKGRFPMMEVIDLPLGYKSHYMPTKLINAYYKKFKPKELDDVKVLLLDAHGPGALNTRKPISKLEDIKGMKIRAHSISNKVVAALGGAPVGMPITDTYDALSKGVVDGVMLEKGSVYHWKLGDVVKYTIECPGTGYSTAFYTVMNKDKWNSLPKDIQVIIDKVDEEYTEKIANMWVDWHNTGKAELQKMGNTFIALSKEESDRWTARTQTVIDNWVKEAKAKGIPGDVLVKFCQDYLKANQK